MMRYMRADGEFISKGSASLSLTVQRVKSKESISRVGLRQHEQKKISFKSVSPSRCHQVGAYARPRWQGGWREDHLSPKKRVRVYEYQVLSRQRSDFFSFLLSQIAFPDLRGRKSCWEKRNFNTDHWNSFPRIAVERPKPSRIRQSWLSIMIVLSQWFAKEHDHRLLDIEANVPINARSTA